MFFFRNSYGSCMLDKPDSNTIQKSHNAEKLAGEKFTADMQCKLIFGPESAVCTYMVNIITLHCRKHTIHMK